ncbi:MAG: translation initiation factor [Polyangiaceae bacterium]
MGASRIVYSTDPDFARTCPRCRRATEDCQCPRPADPPLAGQTARIVRERRKGGKEVTVVAGLIAGAALEALARELRARCGAGGTLKDGAIEVQGDHRERIAALLTERGVRVKLAGG